MAVSSKVGRPYRVPDIDLRYDPNQELYDRFYEACRTLSYSDMKLLGRFFGLNWITIWRWKAGKTFPTQTIASQVILWVSTGKPLKTVTQAEAANSMFSGNILI